MCHGRRWKNIRLTFSLKTLFAVTLLIGVGCGWLARNVSDARAERRALAKLADAYAWVVRKDSVGGWLNRTIGYEVFPTVTGIVFGSEGAKGYSVVERGEEVDLPGFSDEGAWELNLDGMGATDENLAALSELPKLEWLIVAGHWMPEYRWSIRITDAGILTLRKSAKLKVVYLCNTEITRDAVSKLSDLMPGTKIVYR